MALRADGWEEMLRIALLFACLLMGMELSWAQGAPAQPAPTPFCHGSYQAMVKDQGPAFWQAVAAAYPNLGEYDGPADSCVYPYKVFTYEKQVVLISLNQVPRMGDECDNCRAKLSAVFLRPEQTGLTVVSRLDDFAEAGIWNDPGSIEPIHLGTDDGIVIDSPNASQTVAAPDETSQSYSTSSMDIAVFQDRHAILLSKAQDIKGHISCSGSSCYQISSHWTIDSEGRIVISYDGSGPHRSKVSESITYERQKNALVPISNAGFAAELNQFDIKSIQRAFCHGVKESLKKSDDLFQKSVAAAYPHRDEDTEETISGPDDQLCIYPYKVFRFENQVVLISLGQTPGMDNNCHACAAKLSASFLKEETTGLSLVRQDNDFDEIGSWGDPGDAKQIQLGADDAIVFEPNGVGGEDLQGYRSVAGMDVFAFPNGHAVPLSEEPGIITVLSCLPDGEPCYQVHGDWKVDPKGQIMIHYKGKRPHKTKIDETVIYERQGDRLVATKGKKFALELTKNIP